MFTFFTENNLISPNQSGSRSVDSCVNQLLAITHEIYKSFDEEFEVRGVFLDISKAFDKVWHEGLVLKLNQNDTSGNLLNLLHDFLPCRKQRVVPNGQHSSWDNVTAGVPQGSILGPLLFLIHINDLSNYLSSNCKLFADDTSLFSVVNNSHTSAATLSQDLNAITNWDFQWKMIFNPDLSKQAQEVMFSRKIKKLLHPTLLFNNIPLSNSLFQKHLGLTLDIKLNFSKHIKVLPKTFLRSWLPYVDKFSHGFNFANPRLEIFHADLIS